MDHNLHYQFNLDILMGITFHNLSSFLTHFTLIFPMDGKENKTGYGYIKQKCIVELSSIFAIK